MAFATRMGWHIVTLARYETNHRPNGRALSQLFRLAYERGEHDLARAFFGAFKAETNNEMMFAAPKGFEAAVYAFIDVLQPGQHEKKRKKILKLLEPEIERAEAVFSVVKLARHQVDAIPEKRKKQ